MNLAGILATGALSFSLCSAALAELGSASFTVTATLAGTPAASSSGSCSLSPSFTTNSVVVVMVCRSGGTSQPLAGGFYQFSSQDIGINLNALPATSAGRPGEGDEDRMKAESEISPQLLGLFDVYTATGTITNWRIVTITEFSYLEMQIGW